ncbi:hypothetical protein SAMN05216480_10780 [Pustulibacterium marinum]|uniref:Uncharacterized protein n=1 Tax=Pustulibacterium marinum TaxID=1224947 RepID=A0A1I7H5G7_9FLAO|nr:hypothetical protein [Pustulibacterium marinum]SFU55909.1 hypothetical protein SAMN05216480_10780 [Pustulibacterium marinum]
MSFGGSAAAANSSLKNNKRERSSQLDRYQKLTGSTYGSKVNSKNISKEELEKFSLAFQEKQKATRKKQLIAFGIITLVILAITIYFLFYFDAGCLICYSNM